MSVVRDGVRDVVRRVVDDQVLLRQPVAGFGVHEGVPPVLAARLFDLHLPGETNGALDRHPHQVGVDRLPGDAPARDRRGIGGVALAAHHLEGLRRPQVQAFRGDTDGFERGLPRPLVTGSGGDALEEAAVGAHHRAVGRDVYVEDRAVYIDPPIALLQIDMGDPGVSAPDFTADRHVANVRPDEAEALQLPGDVSARRIRGRFYRARTRRVADDETDQHQNRCEMLSRSHAFPRFLPVGDGTPDSSPLPFHLAESEWRRH